MASLHLLQWDCNARRPTLLHLDPKSCESTVTFRSSVDIFTSLILFYKLPASAHRTPHLIVASLLLLYCNLPCVSAGKGPARTLPAGAARPHAPALVTDARPLRAVPALAPLPVDAPAPIPKEWRARGCPSTLMTLHCSMSTLPVFHFQTILSSV